MPKLKKDEINGIETLEFNDSDSFTINEMVLDSEIPVNRFGRQLKYQYTSDMSQDDKSALRRKARRDAKRILEGKPLNPRANTPKLTSEQKSLARKNRRQIRNEIPYVAMRELQRLPEYANMTIDEIRASLRDSILNG